MNALAILKGFAELNEEDQEVLSVEMARTGCIGQSFSADLTQEDVQQNQLGPAFLIYYGPAFLQNLGSDKAVRKLGVLAEVYRCARELWPAMASKVACNVIIRIDTIKSMSTEDMLKSTQKGNMWVMVKHNESEAFIEWSSKRKLNKFIANMQSVQLMDFGNH